MRTFGKVRLSDDGAFWILKVEPHVAMRAKQVFQRLDKRQHGELKLSASEENSKDLEWFLERYPLEVENPEELQEKARAFDERTQLAWSILEGNFEFPNSEMLLPAREYQKQAAALTLATGSLLVADELGLGKSVTAIALLANAKCLPALVVIPTHLPYHWTVQLQKFLPGLKVHTLKKTTPYPLAKAGERNPDVILTSYHKLHGWADHLQGQVKTVIFDECQELRKSGSLKHTAAKHIADGCQWKLGLSATPIYNYGFEFFNVMDVLRPGLLGTQEEFRREWCADSFRAENARIADPKAFGTFLRESGAMIRRTRKEVGRELPPVNRVMQEVSADLSVLKKAEDAASELARIILDQSADKVSRFQASGQFDMKLRQITGIAKAPYVAEFVKMLLEETSEPVVLFGWHLEVYKIWEERLKEFEPAWYTGNESPTQKTKELQRFLRGETKILIMSLRAGSGQDGLQHVASNVVFGELDWSPGVLEQCVGRVDRDGQTKPVFAYYLISEDGSDPVMVDILGLKRSQIESIRDPNGNLVEALEVDPEHVKKLAQAYLNKKKNT